jgi:adenylate cyclase
MAILAEYHAAIGEIIIKYSGTPERYAGDGVVVIFNDPVPVDNPAPQAVLTALDMRAAISGLIEKWFSGNSWDSYWLNVSLDRLK